MKKIIIGFLLSFLIICLTGCNSIYTDNSFDYYYINNNKEYIYLTGVHNNIMEKEYIIIPGVVNGRKVVIQNRGILTDMVAFGYNDNLKKIFILEGVKDSSIDNISSSANKKFIISNNTYLMNLSEHNYYISSKCYNDNYQKLFEYNNKIFIFNQANVSYNYNYDNSPNDGYYWIDDYDNEIINIIPNTPSRSGYEFGGWYKEKECINEWNFEKDVVDKKEYDKNGSYIYKETILYAKWIISINN